jgi:hypothetical protein
MLHIPSVSQVPNNSGLEGRSLIRRWYEPIAVNVLEFGVGLVRSG